MYKSIISIQNITIQNKNKEFIKYLLTEEDSIDHEILVPKKNLINVIVNTTFYFKLVIGIMDLLYSNAEKYLQQHKIRKEHFEVEYKL